MRQFGTANAVADGVDALDRCLEGFGNRDLAHSVNRDTNGFQGTNFNDTWAWDGLNWTQLSPTTSPAVRQFAGMAYDPIRDRTVLYGGQVPTLIGAGTRVHLANVHEHFVSEIEDRT